MYITFDKEILRNMENPEEEWNKISDDILWYLEHRGKTAVRLKNFDNMMKFKEIAEQRLTNVNLLNNGSVLIIQQKEGE